MKPGPRRFTRLRVPVAVAALMMVSTGCGSGTDASDRQEAVDAFQAPERWVELTHPFEVGESREGLCIGPIDCHVSLVAKWTAMERPSPESLLAAARAAGWEQIEFVEPCDDDTRWCRLRAKSGRVDVSLSYSRFDTDPGPWKVRLAAE